MKKLYALLVFLLIIVIGIGIFFVINEKENKKREEEKKELALLYRRQNTALKSCSDLSKMDYYHSADEIDLEQFCIELYVYNYARTKNRLTVGEVLVYLSEEFDADGELRIYSQPENIKNYIGWEIHAGHEVSDIFRGYFIDYLTKNSQKRLLEMNYEEILDALKEYENSPDYISPEEAYSKSKAK